MDDGKAVPDVYFGGLCIWLFIGLFVHAWFHVSLLSQLTIGSVGWYLCYSVLCTFCTLYEKINIENSS